MNLDDKIDFAELKRFVSNPTQKTEKMIPIVLKHYSATADDLMSVDWLESSMGQPPSIHPSMVNQLTSVLSVLVDMHKDPDQQNCLKTAIESVKPSDLGEEDKGFKEFEFDDLEGFDGFDGFKDFKDFDGFEGVELEDESDLDSGEFFDSLDTRDLALSSDEEGKQKAQKVRKTQKVQNVQKVQKVQKKQKKETETRRMEDAVLEKKMDVVILQQEQRRRRMEKRSCDFISDAAADMVPAADTVPVADTVPADTLPVDTADTADTETDATPRLILYHLLPNVETHPTMHVYDADLDVDNLSGVKDAAWVANVPTKFLYNRMTLNRNLVSLRHKNPKGGGHGINAYRNLYVWDAETSAFVCINTLRKCQRGPGFAKYLI